MSNVLRGGDDAVNNATSTTHFGRSVESRAQMLDAQAEAAAGDQNEALNLYRLEPIAAPDDPSRYFQVRGRVVAVTTDGAAEHIEMLAHKYLGTPYPWYGGRDQERVIIVIAPEQISGRG